MAKQLPDNYWDYRTEAVTVDGFYLPATACKVCEKWFPPYMAEVPKDLADQYCQGHDTDDLIAQRDAYRALLDEILDWLACSKWAVDNQKATEWRLRVREIERQR